MAIFPTGHEGKIFKLIYSSIYVYVIDGTVLSSFLMFCPLITFSGFEDLPEKNMK